MSRLTAVLALVTALAACGGDDAQVEADASSCLPEQVEVVRGPTSECVARPATCPPGSCDSDGCGEALVELCGGPVESCEPTPTMIIVCAP